MNPNDNQIQQASNQEQSAKHKGLARELICLLKGDSLVQSGLVVLVLTAALVIFVSVSELPIEKPFVGIILFSFLPLLFVFGAIVFILAILRH